MRNPHGVAQICSCWAHGSAFSLLSGKPLNLPAYEPVPVFEVVIDGDDVLIDPAVKKEV